MYPGTNDDGGSSGPKVIPGDSITKNIQISIYENTSLLR